MIWRSLAKTSTKCCEHGVGHQREGQYSQKNALGSDFVLLFVGDLPVDDDGDDYEGRLGDFSS